MRLIEKNRREGEMGEGGEKAEIHSGSSKVCNLWKAVSVFWAGGWMGACVRARAFLLGQKVRDCVVPRNAQKSRYP